MKCMIESGKRIRRSNKKSSVDFAEVANKQNSDPDCVAASDADLSLCLFDAPIPLLVAFACNGCIACPVLLAA